MNRRLAAVRGCIESSGVTLLAGAGFLLSLIHLFRQLGANPVTLGLWLSGDTLWLANVFTDVFHDHYSLAGWVFSIAPCWCPDLIAVGLFWFLTGNVILATLFAGFIQILLLVGALRLCRRALIPGSTVLQNTILLGTGAALALYEAAQPGRLYPALYQFFVPQTHVGGLIMVLYGLGLGLTWIRRNFESGSAGRGLITAYTIVCFVAGMSNLLFLAHLLLPLTVTLWLAELLRILAWKQCYGPIVCGWLGAGAGAALNRHVFHATDVSAQAGISVSRMTAGFGVFLQGAVEKVSKADGLHLIAIAWFAICAAYTIYGLRGVDGLKPDASVSRRLMWIFWLVCLLSSIVGMAAIIIGGSNGLADFKDYTWTMHYWHPTFLLPIFGFPMLLAWRLESICTVRIQHSLGLAVALLTVLLPACAIATSPAPSLRLASYEPPLAHFLDELAVRESLHYGYAGYWQARPITMLSKRGLRAYAADGMLSPLLWVANREWYVKSVEDRSKPPKIDFVVLDDPLWKLSREAAVRVFGEPAREEQFEGTRVLIYPEGRTALPSGLDQPLNSFRQILTSSRSSLDLRPGEDVKVPVEIRNPGAEPWIASGKYPVTVSYKWFDGGRMLPIEGERTVFSHPLRPGETESVDVRVVAVDKPGRYVLRVTLVQEGVAWFMTKSNTYLELPVTVH